MKVFKSNKQEHLISISSYCIMKEQLFNKKKKKRKQNHFYPCFYSWSIIDLKLADRSEGCTIDSKTINRRFLLARIDSRNRIEALMCF